MQVDKHALVFWNLVLVFICFASSAPAPAQRQSSKSPFNSSDFNNHRLTFPHSYQITRPTSPSSQNTTNLSYFMTWPISDILSLKIEIGPWRLSPARIVQLLDEAEKSLGKKIPSARLTEKFVVLTGKYLNTMVFEIEPGPSEHFLTWADVAEILGPDGLPLFFQNTEEWRSTYFEVLRKVGDGFVNIGEGTVRKKWYQLGLPAVEVGNFTKLMR